MKTVRVFCSPSLNQSFFVHVYTIDHSSTSHTCLYSKNTQCTYLNRLIKKVTYAGLIMYCKTTQYMNTSPRFSKCLTFSYIQRDRVCFVKYYVYVYYFFKMDGLFAYCKLFVSSQHQLTPVHTINYSLLVP